MYLSDLSGIVAIELPKYSKWEGSVEQSIARIALKDETPTCHRYTTQEEQGSTNSSSNYCHFQDCFPGNSIFSFPLLVSFFL